MKRDQALKAHRRAHYQEYHEFRKTLPAALTPVPEREIASLNPQPCPIKAWRSRKYVAQLFDESADYPGMKRLSVNRSTFQKSGEWEDGITWDELMDIKRELGFGDWYAIEIYPRDADVMNVANIRHLWLLPEPLPIGWRKS